MSAPCANGCNTFIWFLGQFFPLTCGVTQFLLRKRVLQGDLTQYQCCQGYVNICCFKAGSCGENYCPSCCLFCESCCCNCFAVSASRMYVMDRYDLESDPCDYRLIRINNCIQCLACVCDILAQFNDVFKGPAKLVDFISDLVYHTVSGCMTSQVPFSRIYVWLALVWNTRDRLHLKWNIKMNWLENIWEWTYTLHHKLFLWFNHIPVQLYEGIVGHSQQYLINIFFNVILFIWLHTRLEKITLEQTQCQTMFAFSVSENFERVKKCILCFVQIVSIRGNEVKFPGWFTWINMHWYSKRHLKIDFTFVFTGRNRMTQETDESAKHISPGHDEPHVRLNFYSRKEFQQQINSRNWKPKCIFQIEPITP